MNERLKEGQLVGIVLKESEACLRISKIDLARINFVEGCLKLRFPSENYSSDLERYINLTGEPGIQYIFPELSSILGLQK